MTMTQDMYHITARMLLLLFFLGLGLTACNDEEEDFLGSMCVQLELKEGLGDISLDNVRVLLVNLQDNTERNGLTDANGLVEFSDLPASVYNVTVSDSREDGEFILTGSARNVLVEMQEHTAVTIKVDAVNPNADLVIKEVYFPGAGDNFVSLFKDQFVEIFNNSSEVIYADGLYVAHLLSHTSWQAAQPYNQFLDLNEYVYADFVEQVPGSGQDHPIEPGKSIVIALNAMDFREDNPYAHLAHDLSNADFERYAVEWLENQGRIPNYTFDFNNPDVPNMTPVFLSSNGNNFSFFLMHMAGPSKVIFRKDEAFTENDIIIYEYADRLGQPDEVDLIRIPVSLIIDGVDILDHAEQGDWKRLPESIDASFCYLKPDGNATYSGLSLRRRIDQEASARFGRVILQTTRNSFADFESIEFADPRGYDDISISF